MISDMLAKLNGPALLPAETHSGSDRLALIEQYTQRLQSPPPPPFEPVPASSATVSLAGLSGDVRVEKIDGEVRITPLSVLNRKEKGCVIKVLRVPTVCEKRRRVSESTGSRTSGYCGLQSQDLDELVNSEIANLVHP